MTRLDHELDDPAKPEYRGVSGWLPVIWGVFCVILVAALVMAQ